MYSRKQLYILRLAVDSFNSSRAQTLCDGFRRNIDSVIQKCWRMQYNVLLVTNAWTLSSPQWKKTISKSQLKHLLKAQVCWAKISLPRGLACWYIDNWSWEKLLLFLWCSECWCQNEFNQIQTRFPSYEMNRQMISKSDKSQSTYRNTAILKQEIHFYVHSVTYFWYL